MDEPARPDAPASPAAAPAERAGSLGAALLRVPEHVLGGLRTLALEAIVIIGVAALIGLVHYFVRGVPRIFADVWTAGTYLCFIAGVPLAARTLLDDLRHPGLIDWWPGGTSPRTRYRMPSTSLVYLAFDAAPVIVTILLLREPQSRGLVGYLVAGVALLVGIGVAAWRVLVRVRHGRVERPTAESASLDVPPGSGRTAVALLGMVVAPLVAAVVLWLRHAGGLSWVLGVLGYVAFAALLKALLVLPPEPLVTEPDRPASRKRGRKRG